jgi:hypothetical protein
MVLVIVILVVILATGGLAFLGQRIGANMEAPNLGAGTTEQEMRSALSPSVLGALLGILPFMIFVCVMIWMATHLPPDTTHTEGTDPSAAPAAH